MRRTLVTAGSFVLLLGAATTSASAHEATGDDHGRSDDRTVILGGLDHPGQLSWDDDRLLVTDAGSGGNCTVPTTPPTGTTSAPAASDDGTADQGPGDTPATPTTSTAPITSTPPTGATSAPAASDDGTADQGPGDTPATPTTSTTTPPTGAIGSATAATEVCSGTTGSVTAVERTDRGRGQAAPGADGLQSTLLSDGSVLGPTGAAATGKGGVLLVAMGDRTPAAGSSGADPGADLLVVSPGKKAVPVQLDEQPSDDGTADQGPGDTPATPTTSTAPTGATSAPAASDDGTADQGPGDTPATPTTGTTTPPTVVPNAVMVVDPTPAGREGDTYALVTDAGARTVWKLTPDSSTGGNGSPRFTVTVFARYDDTAGGAGDFVPTTLTRDDRGTVYVGDGGSTAAAAASVIAYRDRGAEPAKQIDRWGGFTAVNGLAASKNGNYLYVSQPLDASGPSEEAGSIVRVDTRRDTYTSVDLPAPAGVAVGRGNQVFVASRSTSPVTPDDPATRDVDESTGGGQVLRIAFNGSAPEKPLPAAATPTPSTDATVPAAGGGTSDDGTPDQGNGDVPATSTSTPATSTSTPATSTGTPATSTSTPGIWTSDDGTPDQGHGDAAGTTP